MARTCPLGPIWRLAVILAALLTTTLSRARKSANWARLESPTETRRFGAVRPRIDRSASPASCRRDSSWGITSDAASPRSDRQKSQKVRELLNLFTLCLRRGLKVPHSAPK
jgi:hypothetical protein